VGIIVSAVMIVVGLVLIRRNFTCFNDWTIHLKGYRYMLNNQTGVARCKRNGYISLIIGIVLFLGGLGLMVWCSIKYKPQKRNVSRNRDANYNKKTDPDSHSGIIATGFCSNQNKDASDTIVPDKQYFVSYCSITGPPTDASGNLLGHWYCVSFGDDNDVKGRAAYYLPVKEGSYPEMLKMNMCDYYCNAYGSPDVDPAKFQSCLFTSDRPFGYGEYAVWMKNSSVGGIMSCFYLSKQYSTDANNQITSNGQMELDWEVTPNPDDPNNSIICDTNIYAFDPSTDPQKRNRCDDVPKCQQPDDFRADFKGGFPTTSTSYEGALQYIIGVYPDKIQFKLVNSDYELLYLRTIDKQKKTDTAVQYDSSGNVIRQKDFTDTNFEQINKLYTDETTLYPFLNIWAPNTLNWLTDFYDKKNVLYHPKNADQPGLCNNCDGPNVPNRVMDVPGSTSIVFGPFIFTPYSSNKVFKPSDWLAYSS